MFRKGFTIVELLVVIIIIGILAAVTVPWLQENKRMEKLLSSRISVQVNAVTAEYDHSLLGTSSGRHRQLHLKAPGLPGREG